MAQQRPGANHRVHPLALPSRRRSGSQGLSAPSVPTAPPPIHRIRRDRLGSGTAPWGRISPVGLLGPAGRAQGACPVAGKPITQGESHHLCRVCCVYAEPTRGLEPCPPLSLPPPDLLFYIEQRRNWTKHSRQQYLKHWTSGSKGSDPSEMRNKCDTYYCPSLLHPESSRL